MYEHKLKYAGSEPFNKEIEREDIDYEEMELLEQDETYQRLAELRYLAKAVQDDVHGDDIVQSTHVDDKLLAAADDIEKAVDYYVNQWIAEHRVEEVEA